MTYRLTFSERARKQWNKLDTIVRSQFQAVLARRVEEPNILSAKLRGHWPSPRYKIKLKSPGYRLVYEVRENEVLIVVIAVGRRDRIYDEI
jgi:mRNA interferase RelE/StbE